MSKDIKLIKVCKVDKGAVIPQYQVEGDAGLDLTAIDIFSNTDDQVVYKTGLSVEIPDGHVGFLFPRSSIRHTSLYLSNSVGVIDSNFRGEIEVTFNKQDIEFDENVIYNIGDRIAQLVIVPIPTVKFVEVDKLSDSDRGSGGHGSTGK